MVIKTYVTYINNIILKDWMTNLFRNYAKRINVLYREEKLLIFNDERCKKYKVTSEWQSGGQGAYLAYIGAYRRNVLSVSGTLK